MVQKRDIMGMPVCIEIADTNIKQESFDSVFDYLIHIDERFSTYKENSEISKINRGEICPDQYSDEMRDVFKFSEETNKLANGYFNIQKADKSLDPSGLVKGLAIQKSANMLIDMGYNNFFVEIAGDIQTNGKNSQGEEWSVGIRNPFNQNEIVKVIFPKDMGVATSGTYIRGEHIYNPHELGPVKTNIVSLTVIGPNIYEADRFATAAFAMGPRGIEFIENLKGFEGYAIDKDGIATMTTNFNNYTKI